MNLFPGMGAIHGLAQLHSGLSVLYKPVARAALRSRYQNIVF